MTEVRCSADASLKGLEEATTLDLARLLQAFASAEAQCASWPAGDRQLGATEDVKFSEKGESLASYPQGTRPRNGDASFVLSDERVAFVSTHRRLFNACVEAAGDRILFASPAELSVAAQAFGLALVESHGADTKSLAAVLQNIR